MERGGRRGTTRPRRRVRRTAYGRQCWTVPIADGAGRTLPVIVEARSSEEAGLGQGGPRGPGAHPFLPPRLAQDWSGAGGLGYWCDTYIS